MSTAEKMTEWFTQHNIGFTTVVNNNDLFVLPNEKLAIAQSHLGFVVDGKLVSTQFVDALKGYYSRSFFLNEYCPV